MAHTGDQSSIILDAETPDNLRGRNPQVTFTGSDGAKLVFDVSRALAPEPRTVPEVPWPPSLRENGAFELVALPPAEPVTILGREQISSAFSFANPEFEGSEVPRRKYTLWPTIKFTSGRLGAMWKQDKDRRYTDDENRRMGGANRHMYILTIFLKTHDGLDLFDLFT
ncbi:hypothetical protein C8R47DRAFT_1312849 [Mycena vitilis]|nr:hypothetical protein C8R47DRAFT_1312849 [Mycena vitilis]